MKNQNTYNITVIVLAALILILTIFTSTAKSMECKSEIITTPQGVEVCWVCTSNGKVVIINCERDKK